MRCAKGIECFREALDGWMRENSRSRGTLEHCLWGQGVFGRTGRFERSATALPRHRPRYLYDKPYRGPRVRCRHSLTGLFPLHSTLPISAPIAPHSDFFPVILNFLRQLPFVGNLLSLPYIRGVRACRQMLYAFLCLFFFFLEDAH